MAGKDDPKYDPSYVEVRKGFTIDNFRNPPPKEPPTPPAPPPSDNSGSGSDKK